MLVKFFLFFLILKVLKSNTISFNKYKQTNSNTNTLCNCQVNLIKPKIVNGSQLFTKDLPWVVGIYSVEKRGLVCTGTILNKNTILTAAHCFDFVLNFYSRFILAGYVNDTVMMLNSYKYRKYIKKIYIHPKYRLKSNPISDYDIAIAILERSLILGSESNIYPVCISQKNVENIPSKTYYFSGFGLTKSYTEDLITQITSAQYYSEKINYLSLQYFDCKETLNPMKFFCVKSTDGAVCNGDSGGPLYSYENNTLKQIGTLISSDYINISNTMLKHCVPDTRNVFTKFSLFLCWIKTVGQPLCLD